MMATCRNGGSLGRCLRPVGMGGALLLMALLIPPGGARAAQEEAVGSLDPVTLDRQASAIAGDLMSPYCPGRTLASCPSPDAADLRQEIRAALAEGRSSVEIEAEMERRFGVDVLGRPKDAWGFVVPLAVPVVGVLLVALWIRRHARGARSPDPVAPPPVTPVDEGDDLALERALDRELSELR